jgi:hypothetical protein
MRNDIASHLPDKALVAQYQELMRQFRQLKYSQAPTIYESSQSTVTFSLQPLTPTVVTHRHVLLAELDPVPSDITIIALPIISLYSTDATDDVAGHFTNGSFWSANPAYKDILDFGWWFSWAANDNHNIVAVIDAVRNDYGTHPDYGDNNPDGTTPVALNLKIGVAWHFIKPTS